MQVEGRFGDFMDKALNYSCALFMFCCYLNNNKHATEQLARKKESKKIK
jgi:hypothetical protein